MIVHQLPGSFRDTLGLFINRRIAIKYTLYAVNALLAIGIVSIVVSSHGLNDSSSQGVVLTLAEDESTHGPVDAISGADIAVNIAYMTGLPQITAVINHADSASSQETLAPSGAQSLDKPQILLTNLKSKQDITEYVVVEGDSIDEVAKRFGISSNSLKWSNELSSGATLNPGATLVIPPVEGIVYTVKEGDDPKKLADKFNSDETRLTAFNDAEIDGLIAGERIVIPDGEITPPPTVFATSVASNFRASYGGNGYDWGWCTWYAANKRIEAGRPIPRNLGNAVSWSPRARSAGMVVSDAPVAGAVIWHDQNVSGRIAGGLGHVGYVESVEADGSIIVSDMNSRGTVNPDGSGGRAGGWSRVSYRKVTPDQFSRYDFIY